MIQNKKIKVINWINGEETEEGISSWLDKFNPHSFGQHQTILFN